MLIKYFYITSACMKLLSLFARVICVWSTRKTYIVTMQEAMAAVSGYDARVATMDTVHNLRANISAASVDPRGGAENVIRGIYNATIFGFAAELEEHTARSLRQSRFVDTVELDQTAHATTTPWNLDRIDQRNLPLDGFYRNMPPSAGMSSTIYVLDTGVRADHKEFRSNNGKSRVLGGVDFVGDGAGWADCNGHGTHCASTAAGVSCGVAPGANVKSVRVLGCSGAGRFSDIISAIDWVVRQEGGRGGGRGVISMSLGGGFSSALNRAVNAAVQSGVPVVVASGNEAKDACLFSPSSASMAITVAASTRNDRRSSFSNNGRCVNIYAPGSSILGADHTSSSALKLLSGTSMACPHTAGAIALAISAGANTALAASDAVLRTATSGVLMDGMQQVTHGLLYTGRLGSGGGTSAPTPSPAYVCTTAAAEKCVFPFVFEGKTYNMCTKQHDASRAAWCSTKTNSMSEHVQGNWGYCRVQDGCPLCGDHAGVASAGCEKSAADKQLHHNRAVPVTTLALVCMQVFVMLVWLATEASGGTSSVIRSPRVRRRLCFTCHSQGTPPGVL